MHPHHESHGWVQSFGVSRRVDQVGTVDQWILRGCSVAFAPGRVTAVVGPSGAGKTSLLHCLSGLDTPDDGVVTVEGRDIYGLSRQRRAEYLRGRVGFVFQEYNLIPYLTARENAALPVELAGGRVDRGRLAALLSRFGLEGKATSLASTLSGGEQQRVALARAMLLQPAVVFADEPTGALDSENTALVLAALRELAQAGTNVIVVTHDVDAAALADGVVFMRDGRITGVTGRLSPAAILAGMRGGGARGGGAPGGDAPGPGARCARDQGAP